MRRRRTGELSRGLGAGGWGLGVGVRRSERRTLVNEKYSGAGQNEECTALLALREDVGGAPAGFGTARAMDGPHR
jgi:hypothetical protein